MITNKLQRKSGRKDCWILGRKRERIEEEWERDGIEGRKRRGRGLRKNGRGIELRREKERGLRKNGKERRGIGLREYKKEREMGRRKDSSGTSTNFQSLANSHPKKIQSYLSASPVERCLQ